MFVTDITQKIQQMFNLTKGGIGLLASMVLIVPTMNTQAADTIFFEGKWGPKAGECIAAPDHSRKMFFEITSAQLMIRTFAYADRKCKEQVTSTKMTYAVNMEKSGQSNVKLKMTPKKQELFVHTPGMLLQYNRMCAEQVQMSESIDMSKCKGVGPLPNAETLTFEKTNSNEMKITDKNGSVDYVRLR